MKIDRDIDKLPRQPDARPSEEAPDLAEARSFTTKTAAERSAPATSPTGGDTTAQAPWARRAPALEVGSAGPALATGLSTPGLGATHQARLTPAQRKRIGPAALPEPVQLNGSLELARATVTNEAPRPVPTTNQAIGSKAIAPQADLTETKALRSAMPVPTVSATAATAPLRMVRENPSIVAAREAHKSTWDKAWEAVARIFAVPTDLVVKAANFIVSGARYVVQGAAWLIASPALLFGVKPDELWRRIGSVAKPVFGAVGGLIEGVVRMPQAALGAIATFCKNLVGLKWTKSWASAVELVTQPFIGVAFVPLSVLFYGVKGVSDSVVEPRRLNNDERRSMAEYYPTEVIDRIRIIPGPSLIETLFMPPGVGAFTLGDDVYLANGETDASGSLIRHESVHTLQYRESPGGVPGFLSVYYARIAGNFVTNGFDVWGAYGDIPFEIEAYGLQNGPSDYYRRESHD